MNCRQFKNKILNLAELPDDCTILPESLAEHAIGCPDCRQNYAELLAMQQKLYSLRRLEPPPSVIDNYMVDLNRKLMATESDQAKQHRRPAHFYRLPAWPSLRPMMAAATIALVAIGIWWFGIHPRSVTESNVLATDSIDFYLDSFTEASAQNPVALVNGLEYDWVYYENTSVEK